MLVFRCTQRVIREYSLTVTENPPPSTGVLGDWYVNLHAVQGDPWIICMSERSLLPLFIPARNSSFPARFSEGLVVVLNALRVREDRVIEEIAASTEIAYGRTHNRRVLGTMNDAAIALDYFLMTPHRKIRNLAEISLDVAESPYRAIGYESPDRLTRALFETELTI